MRSVLPHPRRVALIALAICCAALAASVSPSQAAAPPILTSPAASTTVGGSIQVTYTLPATPVAGTVTLAFAGGTTTTLTLAGTATSGSFTFQASNPAGSPSVSSVAGTSAIADGPYAVTLTYEDSGDSTTASATSTNVVVDNETQAPTLSQPASGTYSGALPVNYVLPQTALPGSVTLTFVGPVTRTLTMVNTNPGSTFFLNPANPLGAAQVTSIAPASSTIPDGTYTIVLGYENSLGDPVATTSVSNVTLDNVTQAPTLSAPTAGTISGPIPVMYTLPETAHAGSVKLTFTGAVTRTLTMQNTAPSGTFNLNPANPTASSQVVSIAPSASTIPDGTYGVTVSYQDSIGNPVAFSAPATVTLDNTTLTPTVTAPSSGAKLSGAIGVSFSLPEAAQAGSVKLTLAGAKTYTLSLGDTSAGTHSPTIDPAAPATSADVTNVAGGASIAPGAYTLTLSYRDALGNPAATSAAVTVTLSAPSSNTPVTITVTSTPSGASVSALTGAARVKHACRRRRGCKPPTFSFTATAAETVVLRFTGKHGRRELTVNFHVAASGPWTVGLTRAQWRRLRRGPTTVVASVGSSSSTFHFVVR